MSRILSGVFIISLLGACGLQAALAGVVVGGTRIVYDASKKEASISISNTETKAPFLIQSWVEPYPDIVADNIPFIITPPLFRLGAGKENILRIIFTGGELPQDRESIFLTNIKSIPASEESSENRLILSVKTQVKLIYRPAALKAGADEAYKNVVFTLRGEQLSIQNLTPYYVSFYSISLGSTSLNEIGMIAPKSIIVVPLKSTAASSVTWKAINDYGGVTEAETRSL